MSDFFFEFFFEKCLQIKKIVVSLQCDYGDVAQLVEQRTENPCVGSSILSITTRNGLWHIGKLNADVPVDAYIIYTCSGCWKRWFESNRQYWECIQ